MGEVRKDMSTWPGSIQVKGSIERNGVAYGCVRKDLDPETSWSIIPAGSFGPGTFKRACEFFDSKGVTEEYVIPEGAFNAGGVAIRLSNSDGSLSELAKVTKEFIGSCRNGYKPPVKN